MGSPSHRFEPLPPSPSFRSVDLTDPPSLPVSLSPCPGAGGAYLYVRQEIDERHRDNARTGRKDNRILSCELNLHLESRFVISSRILSLLRVMSSGGNAFGVTKDHVLSHPEGHGGSSGLDGGREGRRSSRSTSTSRLPEPQRAGSSQTHTQSVVTQTSRPDEKCCSPSSCFACLLDFPSSHVFRLVLARRLTLFLSFAFASYAHRGRASRFGR